MGREKKNTYIKTKPLASLVPYVSQVNHVQQVKMDCI